MDDGVECDFGFVGHMLECGVTSNDDWNVGLYFATLFRFEQFCEAVRFLAYKDRNILQPVWFLIVNPDFHRQFLGQLLEALVQLFPVDFCERCFKLHAK